jgi:hypothetical protein
MINLDRNFTKYVGSKTKAVNLVNKIAAKYDDMVMSSTYRKVGRLVLSVYGELKNLRWVYNPEYKTVTVIYTDGRQKPDEVEPKNTYYVLWIEGLSPERGEKVKRFTPDGIDYTLKMTEALRIKEKDLERAKNMLRSQGIADWVIDNPNTYFRTSYAPKGTMLI